MEFDVEGIDFRTFRTGDKKKIGCLEIEPIHVDHSVPGAYSFIIHTSQGAVVYTGDFRVHGSKPQMTQDLVEIAKNEKPIAVVTEATNMTGASVSSENEVESKLSSITEQSQGILLAGFAYADVDRLNSLYRVAKKTGRCLVVSLKQAYLLNALRVDKGLKLPDLNDDNILVFRKSKKRYDKWENSILQQYSAKVADAFEVSKRQRNAILALSFYDLEELVNIKPEPGSCYVLSSSEPFNEEMEIGFEKLTNWLAHYGLSQYPVHVSGHVMPLQLRSVLKEMNPQRIFPIHTENTRLFAEFMRGLPSTIVSPEEQKEYPL